MNIQYRIVAFVTVVTISVLVPRMGIADEEDSIDVTGPTFIAFFPEVTNVQIQENEGIASALNHWNYSLQLVKQCNE